MTLNGIIPSKHTPKTLRRRALLPNVELVELPIYQSCARYSIQNE
jgi:hypothetical protein